MTETLSHYTDTIRDYCDTCGMPLQAAIRIDAYISTERYGAILAEPEHRYSLHYSVSIVYLIFYFDYVASKKSIVTS